MSKHTQTVDEYPARIGDLYLILYGACIDPGDGDGIMVYVDATPEDDPRRAALMTRILALPELLEALAALLASTDAIQRRSPHMLCESLPGEGELVRDYAKAKAKASAAIAPPRAPGPTPVERG